jgi:hypothetical protein
MLKRRAGKTHTSSELLPVEMLFLRDQELPEDCSFEDDCATWSLHGWAGGWRGPHEPRDYGHGIRPSIRDMWTAVGQDIVAEWVQDAPGTRPRCWWTFDAPEPRRAGEAQAAYLRRLNLLLDGELERLSPEDFDV